ncbi:MAG: DUF1836 domain-containing protein [Firmicutes bacterium]|nr:DUF1836 domain-containing protein [Bacillota bacterium]
MTDPLHDIRHYSPTMTIAQVLKFCERKNMGITRGMVQNYIRDGLLPPPVNKRVYTHKHLAALAMIDRLKTVFDIPTIKKALLPYLDEEGLPTEVYAAIMQKLAGMEAQWQASIAPGLAAEADGGTLLSMTFATELKNTITGV